MRRFLHLVLIGVALLALVSLLRAPAQYSLRAQGMPTPVPLVIPSVTPRLELVDTATPTRTPTVNVGLIRVEARLEANIRTAPSLDAQILTKAVPGQFYAARGRYGEWIQIQFERAPTGLAWVYREVVNLSGGTFESLPLVDLNAVPTPNLQTAAAQRTAEFLTATPGAPQTATALQAQATGVFTLAAAAPETLPVGAPLPTFTYPPPFAEATLPARTVSVVGSSGIPPILPILALGALGLSGLFISSLRRLR
ncbi:MAG: SH3 domain-containing protein [Anaerolineae bacterium]|nr:SH3 domain-containing protein [Anaerolineae bacterium]MDW8298368.1 SH3 domain-containing protein [Anaerolineae bacterium]